MTEPSVSQGGMKPEGQMNPVSVLEPKLDPQDREVLCSAMCHCSATPNISKDGKSLKQSCVAQRLGELDELLQGRSPYKPEISYDMTKEPPVPILDSQTGTNPHGWIPGWIEKYWDADPKHPPFVKNSGMIRRPDVLVLNNPRGAPTQDNIKVLVEMKFPPDPEDPEQAQAYERIAGSGKKVVIMSPEDCDCSQKKQTSKIPVEQLGWAATIASAILYVVSRGRSPRPMLPAY